MGRKLDSLSEKQVATLEWIRDGCPAVDSETERQPQDQRRVAAHPRPREGQGRRRHLEGIDHAGRARVASGAPARRWPTHAGGPEGLIARVLAADGRLAIGDDEEARLAYEELVRLSRNAASRPRGWRSK